MLSFSGHGLKLSPAIGEIVAAVVLGHEPPFDPHPLRPTRVADGDHMFCAYGPSARARPPTARASYQPPSI